MFPQFSELTTAQRSTLTFIGRRRITTEADPIAEDSVASLSSTWPMLVVFNHNELRATDGHGGSIGAGWDANINPVAYDWFEQHFGFRPPSLSNQERPDSDAHSQEKAEEPSTPIEVGDLIMRRLTPGEGVPEGWIRQDDQRVCRAADGTETADDDTLVYKKVVIE